jgi:hypothetical protein
MVEVFKTNVQLKKEARPIIRALSESFPKHTINFDLEDCDKILRVEGETINSTKIITILKARCFKCTILE